MLEICKPDFQCSEICFALKILNNLSQKTGYRPIQVDIDAITTNLNCQKPEGLLNLVQTRDNESKPFLDQDPTIAFK